MAIAFVQNAGTASGTTSSTTTVVTLGVNTTPGNSLIVAAAYGSGVLISSVADSKGNTWTVDKGQANGAGQAASVARCTMTSALVSGDTITLTGSAVSTQRSASVNEYSGLGALDTSNSGTGTGTTFNAGSVTPSVAGALVFAAFADVHGTSTTSAGTGFTARTPVTNGTGSSAREVLPEEQIQGAAATVNPSATSTVSIAYAGVVVVYRPSLVIPQRALVGVGL